MKVISTNLGDLVEVVWRGKTIQTGIFKYPVSQPLLLETEDVQHDHVIDRLYHGGVDKACYIYGVENYEFWKQRYPDLDWQWGMFGENLTIAGINESEMNIGDIYRLGETLVQITQPRQPCFKLGFRFGTQQIVHEFQQEPYPGVYVRVLKCGSVSVGDQMQLEERAQDSLSLATVFSLLMTDRDNIDLIKRAIALPDLAEACRNDLIKILTFAQRNSAELG